MCCRAIEEERPIAVAVVDQKMPQMSGVDLLVRLRGESRQNHESRGGVPPGGIHRGTETTRKAKPPFDPAGHTKAILLTGYAGLDAALEAKNDAGVDRYLEKPWKPEELIGAVPHLLDQHLRDSGQARYLIFRKVRTADEIEALLRIRFEVYRRTQVEVFVTSNPESMDFDGWDRRAHHLSLFLNGDGVPRVVGNMRVVMDREGPAKAAVLELVARHPAFAERASIPERCPFPLLVYFPDAGAVRRLYEEAKGRGESVSLDHAVLACRLPHRRLYAPLGFRQAPGTGMHRILNMKCDAICLWGSATTVPESARPALDAFAARFEKTGDNCHCPSFPACVPGPYTTLEFGSVDLFCPLKAAREIRPISARK